MDKIEQLYNQFLSAGIVSKATDLKSFRSATPEQLKTLYEQGINKKVVSSKTDYNTFSSLWQPVKTDPPKKAQAVSTESPSDSAQQPYTSATKPSQETAQPSEPLSGDKNPIPTIERPIDMDIASLYDQYKEAGQITDVQLKAIESKLESQKKGDRGFFETIEAGVTGFLRTGQAIPLFKYDNKEDLIKKREEKNKIDFLSSLPKEKVQELNSYAVNRSIALDKEIVNLMAENTIVEEKARLVKTNLENFIGSINSAVEQGKQITPEQAKEMKAYHDEMYNELLELQDLYNYNVDMMESNDESIGDFYEELDLFKRNYKGFDYYKDVARLATAGMIGGAIEAGASAVAATTPINETIVKESGIFDFTEEYRAEIERQRSFLRPQRLVEDINSPADFFAWYGEQIATQLPILTTLIATGGAGVPTLGLGAIGATSGGQKMGELKDERSLKKQEIQEKRTQIEENTLMSEEDKQKVLKDLAYQEDSLYSDTRIFLAGAGVGLAEALSERVSLGILSKGQRTLKAALQNTKVDTGISRGIVQNIRATLGESSSEGAAQLAENLIDILALNKDTHILDNMEEALVAGGAMGSGMQAFPAVVGMGLKTIASKNKSARVKLNTDKIAELSKQLENNPNLSEEARTFLEDKIRSLNEETASIFERAYGNLELLEESEIKELIDIDKQASKITEEVKSIEETRLPDEVKQEFKEKKKAEVDELAKKKESIINQGESRTVTDVINRPVTLTELGGFPLDNPVQGNMYVEGQRVVVEDAKGNIYDVGNVEEISGENISQLGIDVALDVITVNKDGSISVEGNTWNIQRDLPTRGIEYAEDGSVKNVSLKDNNGKTVMYEGQVAEDLAYQIKLDEKSGNTFDTVAQVDTKESAKTAGEVRGKRAQRRERQAARRAEKVREQDAATQQLDRDGEGVQQDSDGVVTNEVENRVSEEVGKSRGVKASNVKSLLSVMSSIFDLKKGQAKSAALIGDVLIETMAKRAGVPKSEMYQRIEYSKSTKEAIDKLSTKGKKLFQIVGENAQLGETIKENLQVARDMDLSGKDAKTIRLATGWERGADGKWRYEVEDIDLDKFNYNQTYTLAELLKGQELLKLYPQLGDVNVIFKKGNESIIGRLIPENKGSGYFLYRKDGTGTKNIGVTARKKENLYSTLIHEIQHAIQQIEGFGRGSNDKTNKYNKVAGEVEARNVEKRMGMTEEQRRQTTLQETEDVARDEQIVLFDEVNVPQGVKFQVDAVKASGAVMIAMDGRAIIYALEDPNVSTPLHELAHVYEHYLTNKERKDILEWARHKEWTTETSEMFARGFEKFLAEGEVNNSKLSVAFTNFKKWLTEIYNGIKGSGIDLKLNTKMRNLYNEMLADTSVDTVVEEFSNIDLSDPKGIDKIIETLDKWDTSLTKFGKENLGSSLPVAVAQLAVKAMKAAAKTAKTAAEVVQAGLDAIKKSDWYLEQGASVREDIQDNFLKRIAEAGQEEQMAQQAVKPSTVKPKKTATKTRVRKVTGQTDTSPKVTTTEKKALAEKLKTEARAAIKGFREGRDTFSEAKTKVKKVVFEFLKETKGMLTKGEAKRLMSMVNNTTPKNVNQSITKAVKFIVDTVENRQTRARINSVKKKLKSASRSKSKTPVSIKKLAKKSTMVNHRYLSEPDLSGYETLLNEILNATKGVTTKAYDMVEIDSAYKKLDGYFNRAEEARNKELAEQAGMVGQGLTNEELMAILNDEMTQEEIEALNKEKREQLREVLTEMAEERIQELRDVDDSDMSDRHKGYLKDMRSPLLEEMGIVLLKNFIKVADNIITNGDFSSSYAPVISKVRAIKKARVFKNKIKEVKGAENVIRLVKDNFFTSAKDMSLVLKQMFGGTKLATLFNSMSGLALLSRKYEASKSLAIALENKYEKFLKPLKKKHPNVLKVRNVIARGVYANLIQGDTAKDFEINKSRVETTLKATEGSYKTKEQSKIAQEIYDEVKDLNSQEEVIEFIKSKNDGNYEILEFWMNEFESVKDDFSDVIEEVYGEMFTEVSANYLPIGTIFDAKIETEVDPTRPSFIGSIPNPKTPPSSMNRVQSKVLPKGYKLNLDFESVMFKKIEEVYYDISAAEAAFDVRNFFETVDVGELLGKDNINLLTKSINRALRIQRNTVIFDRSQTARLIASTASFVKRLAAVQALGAITAYPKQFFGVIVNASVRLGLDTPLLFSSATDLMTRGRIDIVEDSLARRGINQGGVRQAYERVGIAEKRAINYYSNSLSKQLGIKANFVRDTLFASLRTGDVHAAKVTWLAYYKKYLKDKGIDVSNLDYEQERTLIETDKVRKDAASYAQQNVEETQIATDESRESELYSKENSTAVQIAKDIFLPYSRFVIQAKMRMLIDGSNAVRAFKRGDTEGVQNSVASLMGTIAEQATFHGLNYFILKPGIITIASFLKELISGEEDEPDYDFEFKMTQFKSRMATDLAPLIIGQGMETGFIELVNFVDYATSEDGKKFDSQQEYEAFLRQIGKSKALYRYGDKDGFEMPMSDLGVYQGSINMLGDLADSYQYAFKEVATTKGLYGDKKVYISKEDKVFMQVMFTFELLSSMGLMEAETYRALKREQRKILKEKSIKVKN